MNTTHPEILKAAARFKENRFAGDHGFSVILMCELCGWW